MKKWFFFLLSIFIPCQSNAIVDPDNDIMGLYFDTQADTYCVEGVQLNETVPIYLILTHPTADAIYGFEAGYDLVGDAWIEWVDLPGCNVGSPDNIIIGFGSAFPTSEATILATIHLRYTDLDLGPLEVFLHGTTPSSVDPAYPVILLEDGVLQSTGLSVQEGSTVQINGWCSVVQTKTMSFDTIKSLYRD